MPYLILNELYEIFTIVDLLILRQAISAQISSQQGKCLT